MIASIVLAAMLCTIEPNSADNCQVFFEQTYVSKTKEETRQDGENCLNLINEYGDVENVGDNRFIVRGCYYVSANKHGNAVMHNILDKGDSFMLPIDDLEVMP